MGKKSQTPRAPMVSSISTRIKQTIPNNGVEVATAEETKGRKKNFLQMLDKATETMMTNLSNGKVDLTTSVDLERIVKLTLLVSGEADSINGSTASQELETTAGTEAKMSMSKLDEILGKDDPAVLELFKRIYNGYNEVNDAENEKLK